MWHSEANKSQRSETSMLAIENLDSLKSPAMIPVQVKVKIKMCVTLSI